MKRIFLALLLISSQALAGGFNGSGTFTRSYSWQQDAANGINISSTRMDTEDNGFASGLSLCITKDGQQNPTANLPMAGFIHTGVGTATQRNQYAPLGQVQDGGSTWGGAAGGTANAITVTLSPPITTLAAGQRFKFLPASGNTGATTLSVSGITAAAVTKLGSQPLTGGELTSGAVSEVEYDGTQFQFITPSAAAQSRAWVSFVGGGSVLKGYNVGSIVRNGAGDYTVQFSNPMPDSAYAVQVTVDAAPNVAGAVAGYVRSDLSKTVNAVRIQTAVSGALSDPTTVYVDIRD